ncbi:MAG TPA: sugar ABC transporter permease [Clostridiaceae bacterium]|jgi:multiple sugar transport system permease protein|nr:sugar ABC transporter permease [Clostridiaceae bacterium]
MEESTQEARVVLPDKRQRKVQKKKSKRLRRIKENLLFSSYLAPSFLGVMTFFFVPLLIILVHSFQKSSTNSEFVGFSNYDQVLNNVAFQTASKNTLTFSGISVPLAVFIALIFALILNTKLPGRSVFRSILLNPMMVPVASVVLVWQVMFSFNGTLNTYVMALGGPKTDWMKSDWSRFVVMLLFLWKTLGYNIVLFLAALNNVPGELLESATIDGAGSVRKFFSIKLVYLYPTVFFVGIMSLISSFKIFREVYLLTGDYPYDALYMLQHYVNNSFRNLDYQRLTAAAVIMAIAMVAIVGILFVAEFRLGREVEE